MVDNKTIGFVGCDKYEILLYLSRILYHLNKKVLLVDFSETEALTQSIPIPDSLREDSSYMDYRGIDFIKGRNYYPCIEQKYDYILIDFGFNQDVLPMIPCQNLIYVTDLQLHNVKRIKINKESKEFSKFVIIKDVFPCKIKPDYILEELDSDFKEENIYILEQDAIDIRHKINSQYSQTFYFHKLSKSMKSFLKDIIRQIDIRLKREEIQVAYKKAERGK